MTTKLKEILKRVGKWPAEAQEEAVETLRAIEQEHIGQYILTTEDRAALARSAEDVRRKRFVSRRKINALFKRYSA